MRSIIDSLIQVNRNKLYKMIENDVIYEKILLQSKKLDKYVTIKMKKINPRKNKELV